MIHGKNLLEVEKLINGKNIAIIGNATSIFDTKYGEEIDSHDVIIRINKGFIQKPESQGKKTTIVATVRTLTSAELKSFNPKYLIGATYTSSSRYDRAFSQSYIKSVAEGLGTRTSTGMLLINWCIDCKAKNIDLYGFDWNKTNTFYNNEDAVTIHNFDLELERALEYQKQGLIHIHSPYTFNDLISSHECKICNDKMEIVYEYNISKKEQMDMSIKSVLKYNPNAHITIISKNKVNVPYDNIIINSFSYDIKTKLQTLPYDKIIYIDADVLCMKSLDELWNMDCNYINLCEPIDRDKFLSERFKHEKYGITSVMVMNLKALREDDFSNKCELPLGKIPINSYGYFTSILNYYFYDKIKFMDNKFNYYYLIQNSKIENYKDKKSEKEIVLLHFDSKYFERMKLIYKTIIKEKTP